jgi:hypothetical protein
LHCYNDDDLVEAGGEPGYSTTVPAKFNILCEKYTPPEDIKKPPISRGKDLVQAVKVTQANLVAFEYELQRGTWSLVEDHPGLAANQTIKAQGKIALVPGSQKVTLTLDQVYNLAESNEKNNTPAALTVNVIGDCGAKPARPIQRYQQ